MPCCEVEPYVRECLDSVLNQPFADWECLVGVETSKDNTEAIICEYVAKDSRFKMFTGSRSGSCSASRNTGIDMATGEYVIFLDGDDWIVEGSLQMLHDKIMERPDADLYPCAIKVHNNIIGRWEELRDNYPLGISDKLTGMEATLIIEQRRLQHNVYCPQMQMSVFRKQFIIENGLKCIFGLRSQDSDFSLKALCMAKGVIPLHEPFYVYRIRPNSVQTSKNRHDPVASLMVLSCILKSLFAFHANCSKRTDFNPQITTYWSKRWTQILLLRWFSAQSIKRINRKKRRETLEFIFCNGFEDFNALLKNESVSKRIACFCICLYVRFPILAYPLEFFLKNIYILMTSYYRKLLAHQHILGVNVASLGIKSNLPQ